MMDVLSLYLCVSFFVAVFFHTFGQDVCQNSCISEGKCQHKQESNTCFYLFKDSKINWTESKELCEKNNLTMAIALNKTEGVKFMNGLVDDSEAAWLDGKVKDFTNWKFVGPDEAILYKQNGEPKDVENKEGKVIRSCGRLKRERGDVKENKKNLRTKAADCLEKNYFICRIGTNVLTCNINSTWFEARRKCVAFGGDLFYLTKEELNDSKNLTTELKRYITVNSYFIGFKNFRAQWQNKTDILDYEPRGPNGRNENCIMVLGNDSLNDVSCDENHYALCQETYSTRKGVEHTANETRTKGTTPSVNSTAIVLGVLLAVFIVIAAGAIMYIVFVRHRKSEDVVEMCDNPEYDETVVHYDEIQ